MASQRTIDEMSTDLLVSPPALSLREIMDEEFARKMQEEEQAAFAPATAIEETPQAPATPNVDEDEDAAVARALALSLEEDHAGVQEMDEDFMMALKLQEQFDAESNALYQQHKQGNAKVQVSYDNFLVDTQYAYQAPETRKFGAGDYDEVDDEEYDDIVEDEHYFADGDVTLKTERKPHGRLEPAEFITKHDAVVCGLRNAAAMETHNMTATGDLKGTKLSNPVYNSLKQHAIKTQSQMARHHGRADRCTQDSVLDDRTRILLYKLLNNEVYDSIHGVISTGKEANVYYAAADDGRSFAVKIYRTSLNEFKDRDMYIRDDFRFRGKSTAPKGIIKAWAEKEMKNLHRLAKAGVPCPTVECLKDHVLVMEFIGKDGVAAPRLKEASLSSQKLCELYMQIIRLMRTIYTEARLVHADLSEYNILYYKGAAVIIDVAQSVEHDHPNAMEFLKRDCDSMTLFFHKKGMGNIMTVRELFEYITDKTITSDNEMAYLDRMQAMIDERGVQPLSFLREPVFLNSYIPRTLSDVNEPLDELSSDGAEVFHQSVTGMKRDLSGVVDVPELLSDGEMKHERIMDDDRTPKSREELKKERKQAKREFKRQRRERRAQKSMGL